MVSKATLGGTAFVPQTPASSGPAAPASTSAPSEVEHDAYGLSTSAAPVASAGPQALLTGKIATHFPAQDLGAIETRGRWATGFSLDGGSVRLMWINARRVNDQADKRGFEISFFLQGPAIAKLKERLQKQGAQTTTLPFYAAELAPDAAEGKDTLIRGSGTWSPGGQALMLHTDDKYTVHLVDQQPEALKGAVRIRVYGDDAPASASFTEVVNKLGLQHVFAPPTAQSLERFKLARFLWAHRPELLESALWAGFSELDAAAIGEKLEALDLDPGHAAWAAIEAPKLEDEKVARRLKLGLLLWSKSPKAFFDWAKSDSYSQNGILPTSTGSSEYSLNNALQTAGVKADSEEYAAALATTPSAADAKKFYALGFLIKQAASAAEGLLLRSLDQVPPAKLKGIIEAAGIDLSGDRLAKLEFQEVYPGYFTAYDPQLPDRLKDKGARYLYSTLDNPERVFEVLTGGQKASLTRFQEGKLIQGKSSSSDFGTGGAFSVFTRLVTESVIDQAKKKKGQGGGGGYYGTTGFNNWGGSRPYKVILNRRILGRTDWYGYNGDNFGRSTGLKAANHAEQLIETINGKYSGSNELMFPVGNDPKFFDFVVCETEQQKTSLITYLQERGIYAFNGKPLQDFVRVETSFFEHPDDLTVEAAIRDALAELELKSAEQAARGVAGPFAQENAAAHTQAAALSLSQELLPEVLKSLAQSAGQYTAQQQATTIIGNGLKQLTPAVEQAAIQAAKAAAETVPAEPPASLGANSRWNVQNQLQHPVQTKLTEALKEAGPAIASAAAAEAKAALPPDADAATVKNAVRAAVQAALNAGGKAAVAPGVKQALLEQARTVAEGAVKQNATHSARSTLSAPLTTAAVEAGKSQAEQDGILGALRAEVLAAGGEAVKSGVESSVKNSLSKNLRSKVQQQTKQKAEGSLSEALGDSAKNSARAAAHQEVEAAVIAAAEKFNEQHPDKKVSLSGAQLEALVETGLKRADEVARWFTGAELGQSIDPLLQGAIDAAVGEVAGADQGPLISQTVEQLLLTAADQQLQNQLRNRLTQGVNALLDELAAQRAEVWVQTVAPQLAEEVLDQLIGNVQPHSLSQVVNQLANAQADAA